MVVLKDLKKIHSLDYLLNYAFHLIFPCFSSGTNSSKHHGSREFTASAEQMAKLLKYNIYHSSSAVNLLYLSGLNKMAPTFNNKQWAVISAKTKNI